MKTFKQFVAEVAPVTKHIKVRVYTDSRDKKGKSEKVMVEFWGRGDRTSAKDVMTVHYGNKEYESTSDRRIVLRNDKPGKLFESDQGGRLTLTDDLTEIHLEG